MSTVLLFLQAMSSLQVLSKTMGRSITEIMEPHKDVLQDMIPPKKHLLRHQPLNAQIGLMEGNTFCTTMEPRLFTIDLNTVEHKVYFTEVRSSFVYSRWESLSVCDTASVAWWEGLHAFFRLIPGAPFAYAEQKLESVSKVCCQRNVETLETAGWQCEQISCKAIWCIQVLLSQSVGCFSEMTLNFCVPVLKSAESCFPGVEHVRS